MAERAGAAIDVELFPGNAEVTLRRHRNDRERFVDFEQVDVADRPADLVEQFSNGRDRRGGEPLRLLAVGRMAPDLGKDRQALAIGERSFCQDQCCRTVGIRRRGRRGNGPIGAERGLEARDLGGIDLQRNLVVADRARTGLFRHRERNDLGLEGAGFHRLACPRQRLHRVGVLVLARELIGFRGGLAEIAHRASDLISVLEAVDHHVVDDPVMAGAITGACFRQQIGRITHAFHATGYDDVGGTGGDDVVRQHGRLHAGTADLVDGGRTRRIG